MNKKVLIVSGHPNKDSLTSKIAAKYKEGALLAGAEVKEIVVKELKFDPILFQGYKRTEKLEDDIISSQELIAWANHIVFIYPNWWGTYPALFKGFLDKVLWPGFAFQYRNGSSGVDQLLTGKSARVFVTMDTPLWFYNFVQGRPGHRAIKGATLKFCGIRPVKFTTFTPVRNASEKQINSWLEKVYSLGSGLK
ncbi:MAG: NAD(P)H-dependent oxidoreductase [Bacteroidales bacterium]|nr:NAD(P)H-dependent oxidoreductase [Bacteroidales bacterium]MCB8999093.1 NAD(P)H-dependent oxidoreductase [Bacteroidales bacterium]